MRYKNNTLDKLENIKTSVSRLELQISRNYRRDEILDTIEELKERIADTVAMISVEPDEFENQFAPKR